jgi:cyanophycin synthetase
MSRRAANTPRRRRLWPRETSEDGVYKVAVEYDEESLGRACLGEKWKLIMAAVHDQPFDVAGEVQRLRARL